MYKFIQLNSNGPKVPRVITVVTTRSPQLCPVVSPMTTQFWSTPRQLRHPLCRSKDKSQRPFNKILTNEKKNYFTLL